MKPPFQFAAATAETNNGPVTTLDLLLLVRNIKANIAAIAAQSGLTLTQVYMLYTITEHGEECSMGSLAEALTCDPSYVTGLIEKLLQLGLVSRQESPHDRRRKTVQLTPEGSTRLAKVMNAIPCSVSESQVTREEMNELRRILMKLNASFPKSAGCQM